MKGGLRLLGGRKLRSPIGQATRPTTSRVREAVMNILSEKLKNSCWLDLFSGSGALSCEALQKGAKRVLAVDNSFEAYKACQANLEVVEKSLGYSVDIKVIKHEVISFLRGETRQKNSPTTNKFPKRFDLVYLDPPYSSNLYLPVLEALLSGDWVGKNSIVICEHSAKEPLDIPDDWSEADRRIYGESALLLVKPTSSYFVDIDSKHPQKGQGL